MCMIMNSIGRSCFRTRHAYISSGLYGEDKSYRIHVELWELVQANLNVPLF